VQILVANFAYSICSKDLENGGDSATKNPAKAQAGTAEYLIELEERRSIKVTCHCVIPNHYPNQCK
jgi:hypothetical protein